MALRYPVPMASTFGRSRKRRPVLPDVAELLERVQRAPRGGRREPGERGDFAQRELRMLAGERLEHPQPALQGGDEFGLRVFRHAKSPDYSVL